MNMKNKNRLEIRLDPDSLELLNSLLVRTSLTKTSLIKKALIVYASALKKGHVYTVRLKGEEPIIDEKTSKDVKKEVNQEDWEKMFEDEDKVEELKNTQNDDELPF